MMKYLITLKCFVSRVSRVSRGPKELNINKMGTLNSKLRETTGRVRTHVRYWYNRRKRLRKLRKEYDETLRGSRRIEIALRHDFEEKRSIARVLFLGLKDSGRRTIFKQFDYIYRLMGERETNANRMLWRHCVHLQIVFSAIRVLRKMQRDRRVMKRKEIIINGSKTNDDGYEEVRKRVRMDEKLEDTFGEAYDDEDPVVFGEDEEDKFFQDTARRVLKLAKTVNADLERIEHMFAVYQRKCEEKDERDQKQKEEEAKFKKSLKVKFRETKLKDSNYFRKTKILLGLERDTAVEFAAFRERESRLFYRERHKTIVDERKRRMTAIDLSDNESEEDDSDSDMTFRKTVVFHHPPPTKTSGTMMLNSDTKIEEEEKTQDEKDQEEEDEEEEEEKEEEEKEEEEEEDDDMSGYIEELLHTIKRMSRRRLLLFRKENNKNTTVLNLMQTLWNNSSFRENLIHCCSSGILCSGVKRLFEDMDRICQEDWIPNAREMMTSRRYLQSGLSVSRVNIAGHPYVFFLVSLSLSLSHSSKQLYHFYVTSNIPQQV